jgi:flavin-dependent dehydrogenase
MAERALTAGVKTVPLAIRHLRQDDEGVEAHGIRARWMIAADGLHSPVRRLLRIPAVAGTPRRYGVRWHFGTRRWSDFVEVHWSRWGEAYVTPVAEDLVGVAVLTAHKPDLAWFPTLARRLGSTPPGRARGCGPLRQVVARRVDGRVLLVGDAGGYEDALTGEGISLAVKQAAAAVAAIVAGEPQSYEREWFSLTRKYRLLTRGLVLATTPMLGRHAIVPASALLPSVFRRAVDALSR